MIFVKTGEEIELLRESNRLVGMTLGEMAKHIRPGISTLELDRIAEEFIRDHGAEPGFLGYGGFPNTLCISVNDVVVHGIPSEKCVLQEGDIVSIDCGTLKNGFYGDSAYTFEVGEVDEEIRKLLRVTKESLYKGIGKPYFTLLPLLMKCTPKVLYPTFRVHILFSKKDFSETFLFYKLHVRVCLKCSL